MSADPVARPRVKATVKWFNSTMGYGFLERRGESDVFVHESELGSAGITEPLQPGDVVEFELQNRPSKRCPAAIRLKMLPP